MVTKDISNALDVLSGQQLHLQKSPKILCVACSQTKNIPQNAQFLLHNVLQWVSLNLEGLGYKNKHNILTQTNAHPSWNM